MEYLCWDGKEGDSRESLDYKRADFEGMKRELVGVDWGSLLKGNVEEDWICFRDFMCSLEEGMYLLEGVEGLENPCG